MVDFKEDKDGIKKSVIDIMSKIYVTKREKAIEVCNKTNFSNKIEGF